MLTANSQVIGLPLQCLFERIVTVGNATGRLFDGRHGDGSLSANGHANVTNWPGWDGTEVTGAAGSGLRGGVWVSPGVIARVSNRDSAATAYAPRYNSPVWRGARSAP